MPNPKTPILAVDGIILEKDSEGIASRRSYGAGRILLTKRAIAPFKNYWCLPGGHVEYGEKVEKAILREMKEELGIPVKIKKLVGVYSDPKRDPRYHSVSVAYLLQELKPPHQKIGSGGKDKINLNYESSRFKYFPLGGLPQKIGFDHRKIINDFKRNRKDFIKKR